MIDLATERKLYTPRSGRVLAYALLVGDAYFAGFEKGRCKKVHQLGDARTFPPRDLFDRLEQLMARLRARKLQPQLVRIILQVDA